MVEQSDRLEIYISYSRRDMPFVERLADGLQAHSFRPIVDRDDIVHGEQWRDRLLSFVEEADVVLFVLSPDWLLSGACALELAESQRFGKRLIAIDAQAIPYEKTPPGLINARRLSFVDVGDQYQFDAQLSRLVTLLRRQDAANKALSISELAERTTSAMRTASESIRSKLASDDYAIHAAPNLPMALERPTARFPVTATAVLATLAIGAAVVYWRKLGSSLTDWLPYLWPLTKGSTTPFPGHVSEHPVADVVDCTVFAPPVAGPGQRVRVQVFLHLEQQSAAVAERAAEIADARSPRGFATLECEVRRGAKIGLHLDGDGLVVDEPSQTLIWRGRHEYREFVLEIPPAETHNLAAGDRTLRRDFLPTVRISVNGEFLGRIKFGLSVQPNAEVGPSELPNTTVQRYEHVFFSYSSQDRDRVLDIARAYHAVNQQFFQDVLSLRAGERWEPSLYDQINRCDLFLLFWSSHARMSPWVEREVDHALERRLATNGMRPDIVPYLLEGPPPPSPPERWNHLHFGDSLYYAAAGLSRSVEPERRHHAAQARAKYFIGEPSKGQLQDLVAERFPDFGVRDGVLIQDMIDFFLSAQGTESLFIKRPSVENFLTWIDAVARAGAQPHVAFNAQLGALIGTLYALFKTPEDLRTAQLVLPEFASSKDST